MTDKEKEFTETDVRAATTMATALADKEVERLKGRLKKLTALNKTIKERLKKMEAFVTAYDDCKPSKRHDELTTYCRAEMLKTARAALDGE